MKVGKLPIVSGKIGLAGQILIAFAGAAAGSIGVVFLLWILADSLSNDAERAKMFEVTKTVRSSRALAYQTTTKVAGAWLRGAPAWAAQPALNSKRMIEEYSVFDRIEDPTERQDEKRIISLSSFKALYGKPGVYVTQFHSEFGHASNKRLAPDTTAFVQEHEMKREDGTACSVTH